MKGSRSTSSIFLSTEFLQQTNHHSSIFEIQKKKVVTLLFIKKKPNNHSVESTSIKYQLSQRSLSLVACRHKLYRRKLCSQKWQASCIYDDFVLFSLFTLFISKTYHLLKSFYLSYSFDHLTLIIRFVIEEVTKVLIIVHVNIKSEDELYKNAALHFNLL